MRTPLVFLVLLLITPTLAILATLAALLGGSDRPGSVRAWAPRVWAKCLLRAGAVKVVVHGEEYMSDASPRIFIANHVSWFDVLALAAVLPRYKFVAKSELSRIPIFGRGAAAAGTIFIERENRKSAFESYRFAAEQIRAGSPVVVYPEGTRGTSYSLRPFKKGPFVLAATAGVPIVPTLVYGTIEVLRRGSWAVHSGTVHLHFLEPVDAANATYEDRNQLAAAVWRRMADALRSIYGIDSGAPREHMERVRAPTGLATT